MEILVFFFFIDLYFFSVSRNPPLCEPSMKHSTLQIAISRNKPKEHSMEWRKEPGERGIPARIHSPESRMQCIPPDGQVSVRMPVWPPPPAIRATRSRGFYCRSWSVD